MDLLDDAHGTRLRIRRTARHVGLEHHDVVGSTQRGSKLGTEGLGPPRLVRLEEHHEALGIAATGRCDRSNELGWMVRVVVHDGVAKGRADHLEATAGTSKAFEGGERFVERDTELLEDERGSTGIASVVDTRHGELHALGATRRAERNTVDIGDSIERTQTVTGADAEASNRGRGGNRHAVPDRHEPVGGNRACPVIEQRHDVFDGVVVIKVIEVDVEHDPDGRR